MRFLVLLKYEPGQYKRLSELLIWDEVQAVLHLKELADRRPSAYDRLVKYRQSRYEQGGLNYVWFMLTSYSDLPPFNDISIYVTNELRKHRPYV